MNFLEAKKLQIGERQRKEFKQPEIDQLKRSILSKGLLHPPVVTNENELIAGERRVRAITQLYEEGLHFECDGQPVPFGFIPILHISDLTSADLQEAELEENIRDAYRLMAESDPPPQGVAVETRTIEV